MTPGFLNQVQITPVRRAVVLLPGQDTAGRRNAEDRCLNYCGLRGYVVGAIATDSRECLTLVATGQADVVVVSYVEMIPEIEVAHTGPVVSTGPVPLMRRRPRLIG